MAEVLRIGFVGAGNANFGGGEGPWDHMPPGSRRLEGLELLEFRIRSSSEQKRRSDSGRRLSSEERKHTLTFEISSVNNVRTLSGSECPLVPTGPG